MTAYIIPAVLLLAPPLQAVFDLSLQLAFQLALLLGCLAWLALAASREEFPAGLAGRGFLPLWAAAGLTLLSLALSPFRGYLVFEWGNYAAGLLVFLRASFLGEKERELSLRAAEASAWALFGISLLQGFAFGNFSSRPPLGNLNALALFCVLVLPPALERRRWPLAGAMVILIIWTQSLGAALAGLAAAGAYAVSARRGGLRGGGWLLVALAAIGALSFWLLQADSVSGRLALWRSAWEMFLARPLAGFGWASFTWAQAGFQAPGAEHSIYAHNHYLEFLAENGLPAAAACFWLLFSAVKRLRGAARFSVIAALAHSLVDFGLSVPANLWLFCFLLASPADPGTARVRKEVLRPALVFSGLLAAALLSLCWRGLAFEKSRRAALAAALAGDLAGAETALRPELSRRLFRLPALEFLGRLSLTARGGESRAAVYYEMALLENRWSAGAWRALARIYSASGRPGLAAGLERRRREVYE